MDEFDEDDDDEEVRTTFELGDSVGGQFCINITQTKWVLLMIRRWEDGKMHDHLKLQSMF